MWKSIRPVLGISSCLMGEKVRFDGQHKRDEWLVDQLANVVTFLPVCPEIEMGLGAPRESMRLVEKAGSVRLVANKSEKDMTPLAASITRKILRRLPDLDGYVFKKNSPTCGLERVRIDTRAGVARKAQGVFAAAFGKEHPTIPSIEEGRLTEPEQREHFCIRIFGYRRWKTVPARTSAIQAFHQEYKLVLLSHSPRHYRELGKIAANPSKKKPSEVHADYGEKFLEALAVPSSTGKRVNVLQHILGYFKRELSAREKQGFAETIDEYRSGALSLLAALESIRHLLRRLPVPYLEGQLFFEPYPKELRLRRYL